MPECYAAMVDTTTGENIVVLQDMRHYRAADQLEGVSREEAKLIIDAFVPLHAKFWADTDTELLTAAMRINGEYPEGFSPGVEGTYQRCAELFGYCITPDVLAELDRYIGGIRPLHHVMGNRTQTLVHGDVRLDNVMFGDDSQHPVVLIDWQAVMVSNPMQDMAYLLSQNLTIDDRRAHEDELVRYYHARLTDLGVEGYSLEQCWDDYDVAVLYLLSYPLVIGGSVRRRQRAWEASGRRGASPLLADGDRSRAPEAHSLLGPAKPCLGRRSLPWMPAIVTGAGRRDLAVATGPSASQDRCRPAHGTLRSSLDEGLDLGGQIGRGRHRGDLVGDPNGGFTV